MSLCGRVEVFHNKEFFNGSQLLLNANGAVVGRFLCAKEKTCVRPEFITYCQWVLEQIFLAEGDPSNFSKSQAEDMAARKLEIEALVGDGITLSDFEYIVL